jgi:TRAP-type C4-dicarboxylate transport system substrate-binding protein
MKTERIIALVLVLFVLSLGISGSAFAQKKPVILRLVTAAPAGEYPQTYSLTEMAKRFNERAKGEYVIEVHPGGALAKLPEFFDAVRVGAVEMQFSNWGIFSFLDPRFGLLEVPFLFDNMFATNGACKDLMPLYDQIFQEKFNAKALCMANTGGLSMFSSKPVKTMEDWKGLLAASVSPSTSTMIKALGGSPVTIMFPDLYESLQKKVVDAATMSSHGGVVLNLVDPCKHFTVFYGVSAFAGQTINLDVWKKMPKNIQQILLEEANRSAEWLNAVLVGPIGEEDMKAIKAKGVSVSFVTKAERERWARALGPNKEKQLSNFGDLGKKIKKIADDVNKVNPYSERGLY